MKRNGWAHGLSVTGDGSGVVALAGSAAVRLLADQVGLTGQLSKALTRRGFVPAHDRGQVLVDMAMVLVAGGEAIGDIDTLRHEPAWGQVASPATHLTPRTAVHHSQETLGEPPPGAPPGPQAHPDLLGSSDRHQDQLRRRSDAP